MKITLDNQLEQPYNQIVTIEGSAETLTEAMELIRQALLGLGYHSESIKDYFGED